MIASGAVAFCVALLLVPLIRNYCVRTHRFDRPGPLKIHSRPIPRLGGIAIFIAVLGGTFATSAIRSQARPFAIGLTLVWFGGVVDDLYGLNPFTRLLGQFVAAALLWYQGWRLPLFSSPIGSLISVCLFVAFTANSFNFLDGADGLASGVTTIIAGAYLILPHSAISAPGLSVAAALAGSCFAFLFYNYPPANIFMGDSGSTTLGYVVAFLSLDFCRIHPAARNAMAFPFIAASLPLIDAFVVILRRISQGRSPLFGDRLHFYDLLLLRAATARSVAITSYLIATATCLLAIATVPETPAHTRVMLASAGIIVLVPAIGFSFLPKPNTSQRASKLPAAP